MQTEFAFRLPLGYQQPNGQVHRDGTMRLATAMDEIAPLRDLRVRANEAYLAVLLLSRVITQLGTLSEINTETIENLFATDMAYLQDFYRRINETGAAAIPVVCPHCGETFMAELAPPTD